MNNQLKIIILSIVSLLYSQLVMAKCLTYAELMRLSKMEQWSEINDSLAAKGFNYTGTGYKSSETKAFWTKQCSIEFSDNGISKITPHGSSYEVLKLNELNKKSNKRNFTYYFDSKYAYKAFLEEAKKDGFMFLSDRPDDNSIYSHYRRIDSLSAYHTEFIDFYIRNNRMFILDYWGYVTQVSNTQRNEDYSENSNATRAEEKLQAEKKKREEEAVVKKKKEQELALKKKKEKEAAVKKKKEVAEKKRKEEATAKKKYDEERNNREGNNNKKNADTKQYSKSSIDNKNVKDIRAFRYQHLAALDGNFKELESHPTSGTILIGSTDDGEWIIVDVAGTELSGKVVKSNPIEKPDKNYEIYSCLFGADYEGQRVPLVLDEYYDLSTSKLVPEKVVLSMLDPKTAETTVAFLFTRITRAR